MSLAERASAERTSELVESLAEIRARAQAASSSSPSHTPTLVAVSKIKPASDILACYEGGLLDFGENYVQELEEKARVLPADIRWHFIGTLQSNKAKTPASIPNLHAVQTLNSTKGANALNKALLPSERPTPLRVLIQVNTSGETSKSGLDPLSSASEDLDSSELTQLARYVLTECAKLRLEGLMTIGALELSLSASSEVEKNADFERLKEYLSGLSGDGEDAWGKEGLGGLTLSMGMSSDFEAALKAGSDIERAGTRIFGQRPVKRSTQSWD